MFWPHFKHPSLTEPLPKVYKKAAPYRTEASVLQQAVKCLIFSIVKIEGDEGGKEA